jgi:dTDP-glucose 4,6-dehydratase
LHTLRTILVTGGAGFIGSNFILSWLQQGLGPVINLDKLTYAGNVENLASLSGNPRYTLVRGDIRNTNLVRNLLEDRRPSAVIHFAAESHVDRSITGPRNFLRANVEGTFSLLEASHAYFEGLGGTAKYDFRFLHVSTDEVYGSLRPEDPAFNEDTPYAPNSPYAASKAASDHFVRAWVHTYGLPAIITNCSNNYGPYQFPEKLIPLMIINALRGKSLPIYGDGLQVRDWLYVADHASALLAVLERGRIGETYNIGGGNQRTNLEVVEKVCTLLDRIVPESRFRPHRQLMTTVTDRPGHDRRYAIDARKLENELGWKPAETFETGLRKTVEWYVANPLWIANATDREYQRWIRKQYREKEERIDGPVLGFGGISQQGEREK